MTASAKPRLIFTLSLIIALLLIFPGCTNRREVNKLGLLGAVGLDIRGDGKRSITLEIVKPSGHEEPEMTNPVVIIQACGDTFFDAMRNATDRFDRKIFLTTSRVLILSEKAARQGIIEILDFWIRDHEPRSSDYLLIAKDSDASDIVGVSGGIGDIPSLYLEELINANKATSKSINKRAYQFLKEYYAEGLQPTIGVIRKITKPKSDSDDLKFELELEGSAIIQEDKLKGFLDGIETRALNFITGDIASGIILTSIGDPKIPASIELVKASSKTDVEMQDDKYILKSTISIDGMLGSEPEPYNLKKTEVMEALEQSCSQEIKSQTEALLEKMQKDYGLDIFGFGKVVHRKYPQQWKIIKDDWDKIFTASKFTVEVKTNISRSGLLNLPLKRKPEK